MNQTHKYYNYSYNYGDWMKTTVQVEKTTVQMLDRLKQRYHYSSYNELIRKLAEQEEKIPASMFGSNPKLKPFVRNRKEDHEL